MSVAVMTAVVNCTADSDGCCSKKVI